MTERSHPPALLRRTARTLREETPLRLEAAFGRQHLDEAAHEQPGADEQHQRQRHFRGDERGADAIAAAIADRSALSLPHGRQDAAGGGVQRRNQTRQQPHEDRDAHREPDRPHIQRDLRQARNADVPHGRHELQHTCGQNQSERDADDFAVTTMRKLGRSARPMGEFLVRVTTSDGKSKSTATILDSHPISEERLARKRERIPEPPLPARERPLRGFAPGDELEVDVGVNPAAHPLDAVLLFHPVERDVVVRQIDRAEDAGHEIPQAVRDVLDNIY